MVRDNEEDADPEEGGPNLVQTRWIIADGALSVAGVSSYPE